jgi:hypothetical protein
MRAVPIGLLALFLPAAAFAQDGAMTFRAVAPKACGGLCPAEIVADGLIALDSADTFRALVDTLRPAPIVVRLSSPGGNLVGGLRLGQALRDVGANVIVAKSARCVSACVYTFLGGVTRRVAAGGRIGVHRFYDAAGDNDDFPDVLVRRTIETLTGYVGQMGADPELVRLALSVIPPALRYLDGAELRRYRVVN